MSDILTPQRFAELAEAYGGNLARWPQEVQAPARALTQEPACAALLAEAGRLDTTLEAWAIPGPSPALRHAVAAAWRPGWRLADLSGRARLWWSALGLGVALAGMGAGLAAASLAGVAPGATPAFEATAFGDLGNGEG